MKTPLRVAIAMLMIVATVGFGQTVQESTAEGRCGGYGNNFMTSLYSGGLKGREKARTPWPGNPWGSCDENGIYNWRDIDYNNNGGITVQVKQATASTWTTISSNNQNGSWSDWYSVNVDWLPGFGGQSIRVCLSGTLTCAYGNIAAA